MRILVEQSKLEKTVTVGQLLKIQSGDLEAIIGAMANFLVDDNGEYIAAAEARQALEDLTIEEMKQLSRDFNRKIVDGAVPPESGSAS